MDSESSDSQSSANRSQNRSDGLADETFVLESLKEKIAVAGEPLDLILSAITDAALDQTGASGAALAMWKADAVICRARSGDTAPPIGARLSSSTGISGECFRTGRLHNCLDTEADPLVDVEVCRRLGIRSIAVLPIQGWRQINGILEVFSGQPAAFNERHIRFLEQLAVLAERARASERHNSPPLDAQLWAEPAELSGLLPASDRVGDVAQAVFGPRWSARWRPFVLGALGVVATVLIALAVWLGWRSSDNMDGRARAAGSTHITARSGDMLGNPTNGQRGEPPLLGNAPTVIASTAATPIGNGIVDRTSGDRVSLSGPSATGAYGGASFPASAQLSSQRPSAGAPVKLASKVEAIPARTSASQRASASVPVGAMDGRSSAPVPAVPDLPAWSVESRQQAAPGDMNVTPVLSAKAPAPAISRPVSLGVSGGQLLHRVAPVYPAQAQILRLEGSVTLSAVVTEDGKVGDVKVVDGAPALAQAALDAVKQWRYRPFQLDGKPIRNEVRITVAFKFPGDAASR